MTTILVNSRVCPRGNVQTQADQIWRTGGVVSVFTEDGRPGIGVEGSVEAGSFSTQRYGLKLTDRQLKQIGRDDLSQHLIGEAEKTDPQLGYFDAFLHEGAIDSRPPEQRTDNLLNGITKLWRNAE